ncbi:MAG: aromatic hydrocarbon degradation protein [Ginsengibacter sp.]
MKSKYLLAFLAFAISTTYAQEPADALRYSMLTQNGTARNQAIGGAGASLGGEFSSLFINPAGLGFYKTHDFVITPSYSLKNIKSDYRSTSATSNNNNFALGATGLVISSPSVNKPVKSVTFAIGVNRSADFNNHIYYQGQNTSSSYSEKYLEEFINNNVTDPNNAASGYPYGASLAFNTFLIDTIQASDGSLAGYRSVADPAFGLRQENTIVTSGGITDIAIGVGADLQEKFFFGGTLSFPVLNYYREGIYKESDESGDLNNSFSYFEARETLETKGVGVNAKLGIIYKPVDYVRLGLAVHTPTFFQLTDNYTAEVITDLEGYGGAGTKHQSSIDLNGAALESKYNLVTPLRIIGSASYVFREVQDVQKQKGFVTADIEYVNYKGASFSAVDNTDTDSKNYYSSLNQSIDNLYKSAFNVRLGGEMKFNTMMVRIGGAYYGNPYQNEKADLFRLSGGVGYRNKGFFLDLTYIYSLNKNVNYPYQLEDKANVPAYLKNNGGNIVATFGFKI